MISNGSSGKRRVVVTGIGAISPLGMSAQENWKNALEGKSGITRTSHFDVTDCPVTISGEVKNFDVTRPMGPFQPAPHSQVTQAANSKEARRVGHFALAAELEAYGDSGLDLVRSQIQPDRMGVNIGVGMGGLPEIEDVHNDFLARSLR